MQRLLATALLLAACDPLTTTERAALGTLSPAELPLPPIDVTNRFGDDLRAAALGKKFFFDTTFSGPLLDSDHDGGPQSLGRPGDTGKVACASCHLPESGFSDTRSFMLQISLGAGWGRRRAPSLLDVGQARLLMWDGRRDASYNQVFGPLESVVEMNSSRLFLAQRIFASYRTEYEAVFGAMPALDNVAQFPSLSASLTGCQPLDPTGPSPTCDGTFHGMPGDHAEFDQLSPANQTAVTTVAVNFGKAIGAYERTLSCGRSAFDRWLHGEGAVSDSAVRGAKLFVGKAGCASCHSGPFLSDQRFHNVGLQPVPVQQGFVDDGDRGAATGLAAALADPLNSDGAFSDGRDDRLTSLPTLGNLEGAFRTPTLRCVSRRPTFMHTGQMGSLAQVVGFFNRGGNTLGYPGHDELMPLGLSDGEIADVVDFLQSLDGS